MKKITTLLCCLMLFAPLYGQENKLLFNNLAVDTVLEEKADNLAKIASSICNSNPDSSLLLSRKAMDISLAAKSSYEYAQALGNIGWAYFKLGNIDSSLWYTSSANAIFHDLHKTHMECSMLMHMSSVYESISEYPNAIRYATVAMERANANKDTTIIMLAEKILGVVYMREELYEKSRQHLEISAKYASISKNKKDYGDVITCTGNLYFTTKSYGLAINYYHKALNIYDSANDLSGIAMVYECIGTLFDVLGGQKNCPSLDSALFYYQLAYDMNARLNSIRDASIEKISIAEILIIKKKYALAEKNLKETIPFFDSSKEVYYQYACYNLLSTLYDSIHDYKRAYETFLTANIYNDSLNKQEKNQAIADMLVKYEANKKDTTIALLNARSELAERKLSRTRVIEFFSIILIVLSALLTLLLLNRNNIRQRFKQLQMRNQIASDLHDEVGSSLSSILMLGKIALDEPNGRDEIINKINNNAEEMIERISDIVWATNPKYDDGKNLKEKISNYILHVNKLSKLTINLAIDDEIAAIKFQMDVRRSVFLVIKEAINNILKHAHASVITINVHLEQYTLHIMIADNGNGFDVQHHNNGNGLENMKARTESVGGKFTLISGNNKGTSINIVIPL